MITKEVALISPEMVRQAVYSTRKRAIKLVVCKGEVFEESKARGHRNSKCLKRDIR
jgi:hypothetical protein